MHHPRLVLFSGAFCISFAPVLVKLVEVGPTLIGFLRCGIAGLIVVPLLIWYRRRLLPADKSHRLKFIFFICLAGFSFALDLFVWHRSINIVGAGMSTILGNTQALYLAVFGVLFAKEKFDSRIVLAFALAFPGIFVLVNPLGEISQTPDYWQGIAYGLSTGICYSVFILSMKQAEQEHPNLPTICKLGFVSTTTALVLTFLVSSSGEWQWPSAADWIWLIALAIIVQVFAWTIITKSLPHVAVSTAGVIILTQPIGATVWGVLFFNEQLSWLQLLGAGLTLVGIYLGATRKVKLRSI